MHLLLLSLLSLGLLISCQSDNPAQIKTDKKEDSDIPSLKSRNSNAKLLSVEDIFIKVPVENFRFEGWDDLTTKYRRKLLEEETMDALIAKVEDNHIQIREKFVNEDDENERSAVLDIIVFRHDLENYNVVFVAQSYDYEEKHKDSELISQRFWEFDGRNWDEIKKGIPELKTAMFFEKDFELPQIDKHHIILSPSEIDKNTLSARLIYNEYEDDGLSPEQLITNETHVVNLIWNGQIFELQRKPHELK